MTRKIPVIINVDTGIDDAFAIALASTAESIDLLAVTTSFGNGTIDRVTENTLRILELYETKVPVAVGADRALLSSPLWPPVPSSAAQGDDGLGNKSGLLPYPTTFPVPESAVELMAHCVRASKDNVVLVSCCALTNIAVFLLAHPELHQKIDGIVFSGGAMFNGNVLPTVEANVLSDPEAAAIVLKSGVRVMLSGLEATTKAYVTFEDRERIKYTNSRPAAFLYEALKHYADHYENLLLQDGSALHDAVSMAWLIDPSLVETSPQYVEVDLFGRYTRGATAVDKNGMFKKPPNAAVAVDVDRKAFVKLIADSMKRFL